MKGPERLLYSVRLGTYKLLILSLAMRRGKIHGYWLKKEIYKRSSGLLKPSEGTIYEALKQLSKMGLLKSHWEESERGGLVKIYEVPEGKREEVRGILEAAQMELEVILKMLRGDRFEFKRIPSLILSPWNIRWRGFSHVLDREDEEDNSLCRI